MIEKNASLLKYNTFGINSIAKSFAVFNSIDALKDILSSTPEENLLILGGGSNVLFTKDFDGLVLKNEIKGFKIISNNETETIVEVGAGEIWHDFVLRCIELNLSGVENLSLIPGSVGASPMQNIGAYGVEIKDVFVSLQALHIPTLEVHSFSHHDCEFGYRESVFKTKFKNQYVILNVSFRLSKNPKTNISYGAIESELKKMGIQNPGIKDVSNAVIAIRSSKLPDPKIIGNAGSFFKNPVVEQSILKQLLNQFPDVPSYPSPDGKVKLAAGWLIEKAGWKGKKLNNYGVHDLQALVLVNYGGASGQEILNLSKQIMDDVYNKFCVNLEREVNIL
jgi:UDP-N-acetylmuramate dehydrogenase